MPQQQFKPRNEAIKLRARCYTYSYLFATQKKNRFCFDFDYIVGLCFTDIIALFMIVSRHHRHHHPGAFQSNLHNRVVITVVLLSFASLHILTYAQYRLP